MGSSSSTFLHAGYSSIDKQHLPIILLCALATSFPPRLIILSPFLVSESYYATWFPIWPTSTCHLRQQAAIRHIQILIGFLSQRIFIYSVPRLQLVQSGIQRSYSAREKARQMQRLDYQLHQPFYTN